MSVEQLYLKTINIILAAKKICLVCHENPDGDAWGSLSAMAEVLNQLGKDWQGFCVDAPGKNFFILKNIDLVTNDKEAIDWSKIDLLISLDCATVARTGLKDIILTKDANLKFIEIDHHPNIENIADFSLRFPHAASTCEILFNLFKIANWKINPSIANSLLIGLSADTGNFLYKTTDGATMRMAAELLNLGGRLDFALNKTWRTKSLVSAKLWGKAMARLVLNQRYDIAYSVLLPEDFLENNASAEDLDDLAGFLSGIPNIKAFLLLKEIEPGIIKGSWRSNDSSIDVGRFARAMGGGGHAVAAGFTVNGTLRKIKNEWRIVKN